MNLRVIYIPEEANPGRHGEVVRQDTEARLEQRGIDFLTVSGRPLRPGNRIVTGSVLDAHGTCLWNLTANAELVRLMSEGLVSGGDVLLFDDMFSPGFVSLPYIMEQIPAEQRPKIFVRCLAQSVDPDDFTYPWRRWMRHYEHIVDQVVDGILVASTEMGWHLRVGMLNRAPLYVTGLPFDRGRVRAAVTAIRPLAGRARRVVYASRLDSEKLPHFVLDMVEQCALFRKDLEFSIASGFDELRSNDPAVLARVRRMEGEGLLVARPGLTRNEYYSLLADSLLLLIGGRQDWVSNVAMEASALGCLILAPAFRAFPETLNNSAKNLFVPWSVGEAIAKLECLVAELDESGVGYVAETQHGSLDRTIDVLLGQGEQWLYRGPRRDPAWSGAADQFLSGGSGQ